MKSWLDNSVMLSAIPFLWLPKQPSLLMIFFSSTLFSAERMPNIFLLIFWLLSSELVLLLLSFWGLTFFCFSSSLSIMSWYLSLFISLFKYSKPWTGELVLLIRTFSSLKLSIWLSTGEKKLYMHWILYNSLLPISSLSNLENSSSIFRLYLSLNSSLILFLNSTWNSINFIKLWAKPVFILFCLKYSSHLCNCSYSIKILLFLKAIIISSYLKAICSPFPFVWSLIFVYFNINSAISSSFVLLVSDISFSFSGLCFLVFKAVDWVLFILKFIDVFSEWIIFSCTSNNSSLFEFLFSDLLIISFFILSLLLGALSFWLSSSSTFILFCLMKKS